MIPPMPISITNYTVVFTYLQATIKPHPYCDFCIHPISMPREEVDISASTKKPRKRTLSSYVHNPDNISGDRDQYIKRIEQTINPGLF
jgi:hypothetical protein